MRFGLLGPVEVERAGRPVPISRGHERIVLAVLLLNANRLTPTSRLISALWDELPSSAKGQVHNQISRLRARLPTDGPELIASRAGGYELRLDGHQLDVEEFRLLVDRGRAAVDAARPADAFAAYTAALELWRGPALADVPDEFGVQSRLALQEEHLAAAEARLRAGLALHRYDDMLRDIAGLAAEHPHRERLHEIRMTALVAIGRRAEALAVYREVRQALVDDLGVEPGLALRRLEQQILQGDDVTVVELAEASDRDRATARWFSGLYVVGMVLVFWFQLYVVLPAAGGFVFWMYKNIASVEPGQPQFWESAALLVIIVAQLVAPLPLAIRERRLRRKGILS